jgi:hypothetical protein
MSLPCAELADDHPWATLLGCLGCLCFALSFLSRCMRAAQKCDGPTVRLEVTGRTAVDWTDLGGGRLVGWAGLAGPQTLVDMGHSANLSALIIRCQLRICE